MLRAARICQNTIAWAHPKLLSVAAIAIAAACSARLRTAVTQTLRRSYCWLVLFVVTIAVAGAAGSALLRRLQPTPASSAICVSSSSAWWWCDVAADGLNTAAPLHVMAGSGSWTTARLEVALTTAARSGMRLSWLASTPSLALQARPDDLSLAHLSSRLEMPSGALLRALSPGGPAHAIHVSLRCRRAGSSGAWLNASHRDDAGRIGRLAIRLTLECAAAAAAPATAPSSFAHSIRGIHSRRSPAVDLERCALSHSHGAPSWAPHANRTRGAAPRVQSRRGRSVAVWLPFWFALPSLQEFDAAGASRACRSPSVLGFAPSIPGRRETYGYRDERAYYAQYAATAAAPATAAVPHTRTATAAPSSVRPRSPSHLRLAPPRRLARAGTLQRSSASRTRRRAWTACATMRSWPPARCLASTASNLPRPSIDLLLTFHRPTDLSPTFHRPSTDLPLTFHPTLHRPSTLPSTASHPTFHGLPSQVPYFIGLDELRARPLTMLPFPRDLVGEAMRLRGVPSEEEVRRAAWAGAVPAIDWASFDWDGYCALRQRLREYTSEHLTTAALARYVLRQVLAISEAASEPRLLFVSSPDVEYASGVLYHGLRAALGARMSAWLGARAAARKRILYADHANDEGAYGLGISYKGRLPTPRLVEACGEARAEALLGELMEARLEAGYFNIIVVTTAGNACCNMSDCYGSARSRINAYLARWPQTVVATVDGNDDPIEWHKGPIRRSFGCHTSFVHQLAHVDLHFVREVHESDSRVRRPWGW